MWSPGRVAVRTQPLSASVPLLTMVKWPWKPPGQRWSTVYVTVASTCVGVGEADAVGVGEAGGGGGDRERGAGGLAGGDADGERVGAAVTRWCAGAGRAVSLPRGV